MIFLAVYENWNLLQIMFIYWCQSVIIGIFTFFKILDLKKFTTKNVYINNRPVPPSVSTKLSMGFFFLLHYGFFHFGYYLFIATNPFFKTNSQSTFTGLTIILIITIFFINHLFSFFYNREKNANKTQNIGTVMFFPYLRIIPMHMTILFGSIFIKQGLPQISLILFLILKTLADVSMHLIEHKEELKERMNLTIDKKDYKPGEVITGKLDLNFFNPIKSKELKILFVGKREMEYRSRNGVRNYDVPIFLKEIMALKKNSFYNRSYKFSFAIPDDILKKAENNDEHGYGYSLNKRFKLSKRMAELQKRTMDFAFSSGMVETKKDIKWFIYVTIALPFKPDIEINKEIKII